MNWLPVRFPSRQHGIHRRFRPLLRDGLGPSLERSHVASRLDRLSREGIRPPPASGPESSQSAAKETGSTERLALKSIAADRHDERSSSDESQGGDPPIRTAGHRGMRETETSTAFEAPRAGRSAQREKMPIMSLVSLWYVPRETAFMVDSRRLRSPSPSLATTLFA